MTIQYAFFQPQHAVGFQLGGFLSCSPSPALSLQRMDRISARRALKSLQRPGIICSKNHHLLPGVSCPNTWRESYTHFSTLRTNKRETTAALIYRLASSKKILQASQADPPILPYPPLSMLPYPMVQPGRDTTTCLLFKSCICSLPRMQS